MSQQRITLFFPRISSKSNSSDSKCYFLDLPLKIRLQIYHEAGLASGKFIDLNYWRSLRRKKLNEQNFDRWNDFWFPSLPLSLLAVCRSIHTEATRVLYGENRFAITRSGPRGLQALENLSDTTIRELRFLIIRLNLSCCGNICCGQGECRCGNDYGRCRSMSDHDPALSNASHSNKLIFLQWQRICTRLATAPPRKLALYIISDCMDQETAEMIVRPLLTLNILQDYALWLAREYDHELQGLAKDTVLRLTGRPKSPCLSPFRFLDLPKEIQLNILRYTTLVSSTDIIVLQSQMLYGYCPNRRMITDDDRENTASLKCFCIKGHSAFNFRCDCENLGFPSSLFLVSRDFKDVVTEVFYGRNRFDVCMDAWVPSLASIANRGSNNEHGSIERSIIPALERFPQGSIKLFTSLILKFKFSDLEFLQPERAGWKHWLDTIDLLCREAKLAALTLEVRMSEPFYPAPWDERPENLDSNYEKGMRYTYDGGFQPIVAL